MSRNTTINTRQKKIREAFIEQLKRTPTIETSCQKVGVGRATIYRWMKKSKVFEASVQEALLEGRLLMNDVAENQLFALIGEKKYEAIKFYLSTHNSRYSNKIELSGSVSTNDTPLTKEQKKLIREALKLSTVRNYDKEK
jgi:predicted DNA binding protein